MENMTWGCLAKAGLPKLDRNRLFGEDGTSLSLPARKTTTSTRVAVTTICRVKIAIISYMTKPIMTD